MQIIPFQKAYTDAVIKLILSIQVDEFGVDLDLERQPDLLKIEEFYQTNNGNFWICIEGEKVLGTIALLPFSAHQTALRKMFVHEEYRGKQHGIAHSLLQTFIDWCKEKSITEIYLGTNPLLHAAHRFYEKNGFEVIEETNLPITFPRMKVDTIFYHKVF